MIIVFIDDYNKREILTRIILTHMIIFLSLVGLGCNKSWVQAVKPPSIHFVVFKFLTCEVRFHLSWCC